MPLPEKRHSHTGFIGLTFLHCVFSNVSSNGLPERMHIRIGCICLSSLHCVFSNDPSKSLYETMQSHTGCICLVFLHCAVSYAFSKRLHPRIHNNIGCIYLTFFHCDLRVVSRFWRFPSKCRQPFLAASSVLLRGHLSNKTSCIFSVPKVKYRKNC